MKYCPVCGANYDEEIIRFCTKDGTPLIDGTAPVFSELPSETTEAIAENTDLGEDTIIRRKPVVQSSDTQPFATPPEAPIAYDEQGRSERIVIPTEHQHVPQQVRPRPTQGYVQPPPPPNTTRTVVLTILGTLAVLGLGAAIFWGLQKDEPTNTNINVNANQSTNLNTNLAFDSNFNFNASTPSNLNTNISIGNINSGSALNSNAARSTPLPANLPPKPTPSPIRTALPTPSDEIETRPTPLSTRPTTNSNASPVGTPRIGPRPPPIGNRTPPPDNSNR